MTVHHRPLTRLNVDTPAGLAPMRLTEILSDEMRWLTEEAVCAQVDTEIFFPEKGGSAAEARRICRACPLINDCLKYALSRPTFGVWGGTTEIERRRLRRTA